MPGSFITHFRGTWVIHITYELTFV